MKPSERIARAQAFEQAAANYDARPGYPDELFLDLLNCIDPLPSGGLLEIGCGTGQATSSMATLGRAIVCLEPSPSLARQAARRFESCSNVKIHERRFEDYEAEPHSSSLIYAATAFHWLDLDVALPKVADLLVPGGFLAVFANTHPRPFVGFFDTVQRCYRQHVPEWGHPDTSTTTSDFIVTMQERVARTRGFRCVLKRDYDWSKAYTGAEYARLLRSSSDHILLGPQRLEPLLADIVNLIDDYGGSIERPFQTHLHVMRRNSDDD